MKTLGLALALILTLNTNAQDRSTFPLLEKINPFTSCSVFDSNFEVTQDREVDGDLVLDFENFEITCTKDSEFTLGTILMTESGEDQLSQFLDFSVEQSLFGMRIYQLKRMFGEPKEQTENYLKYSFNQVDVSLRLDNGKVSIVAYDFVPLMINTLSKFNQLSVFLGEKNIAPGTNPTRTWTKVGKAEFGCSITIDYKPANAVRVYIVHTEIDFKKVKYIYNKDIDAILLTLDNDEKVEFKVANPAIRENVLEMFQEFAIACRY